MSEAVKAARLDPLSTSRLDINLEMFEDIFGACERILRTPIPLSCGCMAEAPLQPATWQCAHPVTAWKCPCAQAD